MGPATFYTGALSSIASAFPALKGINWLSKNAGRIPPEAIALIGTSALVVTLDKVSRYMEDSSLFWKGILWGLPVISMSAGRVFGCIVQENILKKKEPELVKSKEFTELLRTPSWKDFLISVAITLFAKNTCPEIVANPAALYFGALLGAHEAKQAATHARTIIALVKKQG